MTLLACMGVRGPGPNHPSVLDGTVEMPWFFRSRLADCCAIPSFARLRFDASRSLPASGRQRRSSVNLALRQQRPDDAGRLVGQGHGHQHARLARQHLGSSQEPGGAPRMHACFMTALPPMTSSRRKVRSPIFVISPSFCLPPVDCCTGVSPSQAAKSRPLRKVSGGGASASERRRGDRADARDGHQPAGDRIFLGAAGRSPHPGERSARPGASGMSTRTVNSPARALRQLRCPDPRSGDQARRRATAPWAPPSRTPPGGRGGR